MLVDGRQLGSEVWAVSSADWGRGCGSHELRAVHSAFPHVAVQELHTAYKIEQMNEPESG